MSVNLAYKKEEAGIYILAQNYVNDIPQADQKTLYDYYDFFSGKEVDMLPYVYAEPSYAYNALVHAPEYYLFKDEVNTIAHNKEVLRKYLAGVTDIIEIGPGCDYTVENKTIPILNCANDLKRYYAIDSSENYLKEACHSVSKRKSDIEVLGVKADLMNGKIDLDKIPNSKKGVLFLGSTLGNFTEAQQQLAISQVANMTDVGDMFILTVDTNHDMEVVLKAYKNNYLYNLMKSVFRNFIKIYPQFAEYADSFNIISEWEKSRNLIKMSFISKKDITLTFGIFNNIYIPKGMALQAAISQKFTTEKISFLFKNRFDILKTIDYSRKMKIFICSRI